MKYLLLLITVLFFASCSSEYIVELPNGTRTTVFDHDDLGYTVGDTIGIAKSHRDWYISNTMKNDVQFLIERMIDFGNTWLYNSFLYQKKINQRYIASQSDKLLFMLYPYFTDSGKSKFKKLVPYFFV